MLASLGFFFIGPSGLGCTFVLQSGKVGMHIRAGTFWWASQTLDWRPTSLHRIVPIRVMELIAIIIWLCLTTPPKKKHGSGL